MPSATVTLKNSDISFCIGCNASLKVGYFNLVGHITGISTAYMVESDGAEVTATTLALERLVIVEPGGSQLVPMPIGGWNSLFDEDYYNKLVSEKPFSTLG